MENQLLWKNTDLTLHERVLVYLAMRDTPFPGNELPLAAIAAELGVSYQHLGTALSRLRKRGAIHRVDGVLRLK